MQNTLTMSGALHSQLLPLAPDTARNTARSSLHVVATAGQQQSVLVAHTGRYMQLELSVALQLQERQQSMEQRLQQPVVERNTRPIALDNPEWEIWMPAYRVFSRQITIEMGYNFDNDGFSFVVRRGNYIFILRF